MVQSSLQGHGDLPWGADIRRPWGADIRRPWGGADIRRPWGGADIRRPWGADIRRPWVADIRRPWRETGRHQLTLSRVGGGGTPCEVGVMEDIHVSLELSGGWLSSQSRWE